MDFFVIIFLSLGLSFLGIFFFFFFSKCEVAVFSVPHQW